MLFKNWIKGIKEVLNNTTGRLANTIAHEKTVRSAFYRVRKELRDMGLLFPGSRLDDVTCELSRDVVKIAQGAAGVMGLYYFGDKCIRIPVFFSGALNPFIAKRCMTDVLRHEFGHALADVFAEQPFFTDTRFKKAFGASYGAIKVSKKGDEDNYVSSYARAYTQEDFAETFMYVLRYKNYNLTGGSKKLQLKFKTVQAICNDIAKLEK